MGLVLTFAMQAAIVVLGWWVVNRLAKEREKEKSKREVVAKECDSIIALTDEVVSGAIAYHTKARELGDELKLKAKLQDLSLRVKEVAKVAKNHRDLSRSAASVTKLRQAVTAKHFEDEHDGPIDLSDPQLADVWSEAANVKRELMSAKYSQFD